MKREQKDLLMAVEGIGDLLVYETLRYKEGLVIRYLKKLSNLFLSFLQLKARDPKGYNALLFSDEVREMSAHEAGFELTFRPRFYVEGLRTFLNQFERVHSAASSIGNTYILGAIIDALVKSTKEVVNKRSLDDVSELVGKEMIRFFLELQRKVLKTDPSSFMQYDWFNMVVLNNNDVNPKFLDVMYVRWLGLVFLCIDEDNSRSFQDLLKSLMNVSGCPSFPRQELRRLSKFISTSALFGSYLAREIEHLERFQEKLVNQKVVSEVEAVVTKILSKSFVGSMAKSQQKDILQVRKWAICSLKFQQLRCFLFHVGAYCIAKGNVEMMQSLLAFEVGDEVSVIGWRSYVPVDPVDVISVLDDSYQYEIMVRQYWGSGRSVYHFLDLFALEVLKRISTKKNDRNYRLDWPTVARSRLIDRVHDLQSKLEKLNADSLAVQRLLDLIKAEVAKRPYGSFEGETGLLRNDDQEEEEEEPLDEQ